MEDSFKMVPQMGYPVRCLNCVYGPPSGNCDSWSNYLVMCEYFREITFLDPE